MSMTGTFLLRAAAVAVLVTMAGGLAAPSAHADWRDRREHREHVYRRHVWRHYGYGYGSQVYVAPPVVYAPPPPPPGINLFFNIR